jgi:hypothetical protein
MPRSRDKHKGKRLLSIAAKEAYVTLDRCARVLGQNYFADYVRER